MLVVGSVGLPQITSAGASNYLDPAAAAQPGGVYDPARSWGDVLALLLSKITGSGIVPDAVRSAAAMAFAAPSQTFDAVKTEAQMRAMYAASLAAGGVTSAFVDEQVVLSLTSSQRSTLSISLTLAMQALPNVAIDAELHALGFVTIFLLSGATFQPMWTDGPGPLYPLVGGINKPAPKGRLAMMTAGSVNVAGTQVTGSGLAKVLFDREVQLRNVTVSDPFSPPQEYVERGMQLAWATQANLEAKYKYGPIAERATALAALLIGYVQENAEISLEGWYADSSHGIDLGDGVVRYPVTSATGTYTVKVK